MTSNDMTGAPGIGELRRAMYSHGASRKGKRTRALLLAAARTVFERDGYVDARVADIVAAAGVAHGTFYTYFDSKATIFQAIISEVNQAMLGAMDVPAADSADGAPALTFADRLDESNRHFLDVYRENAAMLKLLEQQATVDELIFRERIASRRAHVDRVARSIRRLQRGGLADRHLDPRTAAAALTAMVSNFAYYWLSVGEPFDEELAKATLTRMWLSAIGYPGDAR